MLKKTDVVGPMKQWQVWIGACVSKHRRVKFTKMLSVKVTTYNANQRSYKFEATAISDGIFHTVQTELIVPQTSMTMQQQISQSWSYKQSKLQSKSKRQKARKRGHYYCSFEVSELKLPSLLFIINKVWRRSRDSNFYF